MSCNCCNRPDHGIGRRDLFGLAGAAAGLGLAGQAFAAPNTAPSGLTPDAALEMLKRGNAQFVTDAPYRSAIGKDRRLAIAQSQRPIAILVSCSDSRVPPELLFGRGLGELFIVRNAGNTIDSTALGSIEYGVAVLKVPLILVMGHERCGAVEAAVNVVRNNATFPGSIGKMIEPIVPAVLQAQKMRGDLLDNAVRANVQRVVKGLKESERLITEPLAAGRLRIVGARYDLDDGSVDFSVA